MKKTVLIMLTMLVMLTGCLTEPAYWDQESDVVVTPIEFEQLPPEDQARYEPVEVRIIDPDVAGKVDAGLVAVEGTVQIVRPFVPEPWATIMVAVVGGIGTLWQFIKVVKTKNVLDQVKIGAVITAKTIDKLVRPTAGIWAAFKKEQKDKSSNTKAIMPDEIALKT